MEIHVVQPGDTLFRLSRQYNLPMERLIQDNQLPNPAQLVVGQALVLRFPALEKRRPALLSVLTAGAFLLSLMGFAGLIGVVYPFFGYVSIPFFVCLAANWRRQRRSLPSAGNGPAA